MLYDWIVEWLLPLIGDIGESDLRIFTTIFWVVVSLCVVHCLVVVPYRLIMKLIHFDGGLLPWSKAGRL